MCIIHNISFDITHIYVNYYKLKKISEKSVDISAKVLYNRYCCEGQVNKTKTSQS